MWTLWVARNDTIFNQQRWPRAKVEGSIWNSLTDYGRAAWAKLLKHKFRTEDACLAAHDQFKAIWTINEFLCKLHLDRVIWTRFTFDPGGVVG
jgi:hypothetical protein